MNAAQKSHGTNAYLGDRTLVYIPDTKVPREYLAQCKIRAVCGYAYTCAVFYQDRCIGYCLVSDLDCETAREAMRKGLAS